MRWRTSGGRGKSGKLLNLAYWDVVNARRRISPFVSACIE